MVKTCCIVAILLISVFGSLLRTPIRAADESLVRTLEHSVEVSSVAFSPDGRTLASGGAVTKDNKWQSEVKLRDVQTGQLRQRLTGHKGSVRCVAFSPDGKTVASGSADGTVKLWRVQ